MDSDKIFTWLLEGDISIQYQVYRDLLSVNKQDLQKRIEKEGWGFEYMSRRKSNRHWGRKFYQPKWISTHYTLLDLRNLCLLPNNNIVRETLDIILYEEKGWDGGILPIGKEQICDVCVNGMFLNYASYFNADERKLESIIDFILAQQMVDGGFNCRLNGPGAIHSSLHSTLSVLEGITEYEKNKYSYRLSELQSVKKSSIEFILLHQLFLSDRTGEIIQKDFLKLTYPDRWKYNILRAMDYFQYEGVDLDERMKPALQIILKKKNKQNTWNVQTKHPGKVHIEMEKAGNPSRWNTLRALRILKHYNIDH